MGDSDKCNLVRNIFSDAKPAVICIQETKLAYVDLFKAKTFLPPIFCNHFVLSSADGTRGGLLTAWDPALFKLISNDSQPRILTTSLASTVANLELTITDVYGPAEHSGSIPFLQELKILGTFANPWILLGDFNLVRCAVDKNNGQINQTLCNAFNDTIQDLQVSEFDLTDRLYTWSNKQAFPVLARLDRVFSNQALDQFFPSATLSSLPKPTSDHTPLLLSVSTDIPKASFFRFERFWLHHESFLPTVLDAWRQATVRPDPARQLATCIKETRAAAKVWSRCIKAPPHQINDSQFVISLLDYYEEYRQLSVHEFQVRQLAYETLHEASKSRATYWKQRSKHKRIKECDSNTAFHHAQATIRLRSNYIPFIRVNDQQVANHNAKTEALTDYFKSIVGVAGSSGAFDFDRLFAGRPSPTGPITAQFSEVEAREALWAMNVNSAPGPDGFGLAFYRAAWGSVKQQIMQFLAAFHEGAVNLDCINRSHMVLLPKKPGAVDVDAFRPICLQNCCLKILSKLLTKRLRTEIPKLIDLNQTGFIRGRSISDTFVYAMELVQVCHKRKKQAIVLKLDFAKAFDTVNWTGLFTVLRARGFDDRWVSWVQTMLVSSKSAVLVNGCPGPWITCKRGLRQGDPISPYLFLLVAETLQAMIKSSTGIRHPTDNNLPCAVLQYADDTLIVCQGNRSAASALK